MQTTAKGTGRTRNQDIVVLGGSGTTGRRVAERLRARELPVQIGPRSGEPPFDWERAERVLAESGAEWTVLRCSWFMQNFSEGNFAEPIAYVPIPPEAFAAALAEDGVPPDVVSLLRYLFAEVLVEGNAGVAGVAGGVREALGREPRDFAGFARRRPRGRLGPLARGGAAMRTLAINTFVSLDGVMQAPGGPEEDPSATLIAGDGAEYARRPKAQDGPEIQVHGSWGLVQTLLAHDLVDELRLWLFPVVRGGGKRLFGDGAIPAGLQLADSKISSTGVIIATYERAGEIAHGSAALEEPTEAEVERRRRLPDQDASRAPGDPERPPPTTRTTNGDDS